MIDLHSHVLPGLDDGAVSLEESLEMLRIAAAGGTTDIAATPHANDQYRFDPADVETRLAGLREAAGDALRLHYGCEMHLTPENLAAALRAPQAYTIAHRGYLLLELNNFQIPQNVAGIFGQLMDAGMRPILAHPERNPLVHEDYARLRDWVELGCVLQVTAQSFDGRFGKSATASAHELVKRGLAHIVASDGHHVKQRPLVLDESRRYVGREFGEATAARLFEENPRCILEGRPVAQPEKRKWWRG